MKKYIFNVVVLVIALLLFFFVFEIVLRVLGTYDLTLTTLEQTEVQDRWQEPFMIKSDIPGLLYELKKNTKDTNSLGFRGPEFFKQKEKFRIIALGDSVTHGLYGASHEQSWPAQLEKEFFGNGFEVEVINEGIIGYNTEQELIHFKHFGLGLDPDLVVLAFVLNDFEEKILQKTDKDEFIVQLVPKERIIEKHLPLPACVDGFFFDYSHVYRFFNDKLGVVFKKRGEYHIGKEKNLQALQELHALLQGRDIPLLVIVLPYTAYTIDEYPGRLNDIHNEMEVFLSEEGIPHQDFKFLLEEYNIEDLRTDKYVHFNVKGNKVIAQHVFGVLEKKFSEELREAKT